MDGSKSSQLGRTASNVAESDSWRLLFMAVVTSFFPVLQIFGIYNFTSDQIAIITTFISNMTLFIAYIHNNLIRNRKQTSTLSRRSVVHIPAYMENKYEHSKSDGGICTTLIPETWNGSSISCRCGALDLVGE